MIDIDFEAMTYTCPFCGKKQAYKLNYEIRHGGYWESNLSREDNDFMYDIELMHIKCVNKKCKKITVVAKTLHIDKRWDLIPENVCKEYPEYIPEQIREDYREASIILDKSPKAAATLLRRCLQGMIHDFWGIRGKNLNCEITALKDKVSPLLWEALDGLRSIGNIGAHMEKDVNLIIEIEQGEAIKLQKLIEKLLDDWYIKRHEEELLLKDIIGISLEKEDLRK